MNSTLPVIFTAMLTVAAIIGIGATTRRLNWLTQEADRSLLNLTIMVLLPCLILDVVVGNPKLQQASNVLIPPLAGFALAVAGMFAGWVVAKLFGQMIGLTTPVAQRTFAFSVGIVNYSFIPIPLTDVLFAGHPALRDATMGVLLVHNAGVELALWTIGIVILTGSVGRDWWKRVINPVSVTIVVALLINAMGWDTLGPDLVRHGLRQAIHMAGMTAVPLSLILVGASVVDHFKSLGLRQSLGVISLSAILRQGVLPCLFIGLAWLPFVSDELGRVLVIQAAMPSAMAPIILARHYEGDPITALRVTMGTTIIALVTIPLWLQGGLQWLQLGF